MALGDDERTSYFAAAGGPTGLTAGIAELEAMRQSLSAPKNNVITPTMGAGKYWYVDPSARNQQFDPMEYADNQGHIDPTVAYAGATAPPTDLANRTPRPIPAATPLPSADPQSFQNLTQAQSDAQRGIDRRSVYGTIGINVDGQEQEVPLWYKGMTAPQAEDAARMRFEHDLSAFAPEKDLTSAQDKFRKSQGRTYFAF